MISLFCRHKWEFVKEEPEVVVELNFQYKKIYKAEYLTGRSIKQFYCPKCLKQKTIRIS